MTSAAAPERIAADTHMDTVTLLVGNLENMSSYYEQALALEPLEESTASGSLRRVLGRGNVPMVRLIEQRDLPLANRRAAGLFHSAFLFDNEASLAATAYRAARDPRSLFAGASDHLVSEAFYFTDPEGNGIELYRDRPRASWTIINGQTQMDTLYLDPKAYLTRHLVEADVDRAEVQPGVVGHVHLQVGDIARARDFYVNAIGFDVTFDQISSALFVSAGGYHHHMAMNTWNSQGAGPRAASLGLGNVAITVPTRADLDAAVSRLRARGAVAEDDGRSVTTRDPWGTEITLGLPVESADELLAA
ncbi:VOC family protein [Gulosibacter bifidus]|uniref:VOC family protein n=1 Tax=Gulosibacter bifidus TaxID=272239 RepID=A0ABW5RH14_9MICO|nr:VOC family protein [Gulosibacter bifidus]